MTTKIDPTPYQNKPGDELSISLSKLTGKKIVDLEGYVGAPNGVTIFNLFKVIFDDGTYKFFEGEHDVAYVYGGDAGFLVDLEDLHEKYD